ncbi:MAG: hypothetical protein V1726_07275 [Methanobacteriota archaeon]
MAETKKIETRLMPKTSKFMTVCIHCNCKITPGEIYHQEEGVQEHLHSLIARRFCSECYAKYGEQQLLRGKPE